MQILHGVKFFSRKLSFFISRTSIDKNHSYPVHTHDFLEFFFVLSGEGIHTVGKKNYVVKQGDVFAVNNSSGHGFPPQRENQKLEIINCAFLPALIEPNLGDLNRMKGFVDLFYLEPFFREETNFNQKLRLLGEDAVRIRFLMEKMQSEYAGRKPGYELMLKSCLTETVIELARFYSDYQRKARISTELDAKRELVLEAMDYVEKNLSQEIRLGDVASLAYVTSNHFCALFKKATGKTLFQYVNEQRIRKACQSLKGTDKKILAVAHEAGFNDLAYFNRTFRKITGKTPGAYRRGK